MLVLNNDAAMAYQSINLVNPHEVLGRDVHDVLPEFRVLKRVARHEERSRERRRPT